jgi:hypothetical protein
MGRLAVYLLISAAFTAGARAQDAAQSPPPADDPVVVSTEHPRLFLRPARLRLLRRERERQSMRWEQFETLMKGSAPMPEPGFAGALYYEIAGDQAAGRGAVSWALAGATDLHQMALVYDWCQSLMNASQRRDLAARLVHRIAETSADDSIPAVRSRALAAIALFDEVPDVPQKELNRIVHNWWNGRIAVRLRQGHDVIPRDAAYPLMELLHAFEDNTRIDLRESCPGFFKDFPIEHLMSYYPAPYPSGENEFYVGLMPHPGEPDLKAAALSRAAELAMVAYDTNAPETQVLQGWLMHDKFMMRGTLGAPYEFLWADPYQPGLSYYHVPLVYYNPDFGHLFVRSSWDDDAAWFGAADGLTETFADGRLRVLDPQHTTEPISVKQAVVCFGRSAPKFRVTLDDSIPVFVIGLEPRQRYEIEVDDEEMFDAAADAGGILELDDVPQGRSTGIRLRRFKSPAAGQRSAGR